jgi:hypothetical protein
MEYEREPKPLRGIYVILRSRALVLDAGDHVTRLTLTPHGIDYEVLRLEHGTESLADGWTSDAEELETHPSGPAAESKAQKDPPAEITGKLKTKPKEGRADARGNATAWAKFAAHEEGRDEAHMYSATFHRASARLALALERDTTITVQCYVRPSAQPNRMDSMSVFRIIGHALEADGGPAAEPPSHE